MSGAWSGGVESATVHRRLIRVLIMTMMMMMMQCLRVFNGLLTGHMESGCFVDEYGPYVWTAGQNSDPNNSSDFVWKLPTYQPARIKIRRVYNTVCPMNCTNWAAPIGRSQNSQPDGAHPGERCINLWPKYDFAWNDLQCSTKTCFVCEKRPHDGCPETTTDSIPEWKLYRLATNGHVNLCWCCEHYMYYNVVTVEWGCFCWFG